MNRKPIKYTVSATGLSPSTKQDGGIQGDHNVTKLQFNFDDVFFNNLKKEAKNATLWYHFNLYNGEDATTHTPGQELPDSGEISYPLPEWITRYGGVVKVELVITALTEAVTAEETEEAETEASKVFYCFPAILQLKSRPLNGAAVNNSTQNVGNLLHFASRAEAAANDSEILRDEVTALTERTETAAKAFGEGAEWVFSGGNAQNAVNIDLVVEDEISEHGNNPVSGKAVRNFVAEKEQELKNYADEKISPASDYIVESGCITGGDYLKLYYEKKSNGIIEMWGITKKFNDIKFNETYGNLYNTKVEFTLPEGYLLDIPIWADIKSVSGSGLLFCSLMPSLVKNKIAAYFANSANITNPSIIQPQFMIRVIGLWKEQEANE